MRARPLAVALLLLVSHVALAAKVGVHWVPPDKNNDGSPLTDLAGYRVEWGGCDVTGTDFGNVQASVNVASAGAVRASIYPTGLSLVCVRVYARNSQGIESVASTPTLVVRVPGALGKPAPLGQPITLPPKR